ncbi:archease family protein [Acanthamoeba castellanii str. Neff]|uniref:Archease family protein n=1 Tax=Acanthamoeba castellanii (strain ATCC 30010 / Neff) TaxID=1257118 RepID=L8GUG4_ACACF|nr:archease family protein [Acanthamoeba castellanii str. Neff]ELR16834.1 archease family protein [Acanthamoeba castellanii str. Neff]
MDSGKGYDLASSAPFPSELQPPPYPIIIPDCPTLGQTRMEQDRARGGGGEKESGNDLSEPFGYEWGESLKQAYEQAVVGMFGYMTDLDTVDVEDQCEVEVEGHDLDSLLFNFLDEFLFVFSTELIVSKEVEIVEFDRENFKIRAVGRGEPFDLDKHPQGTEVKAITYSAMQIMEKPEGERSEVFVIIDI